MTHEEAVASASDSLFDETFHGCAWAAFIDQAAEERRPPDVEATRIRACRYYEQALAEKNARKCHLTAEHRPLPAKVDRA